MNIAHPNPTFSKAACPDAGVLNPAIPRRARPCSLQRSGLLFALALSLLGGAFSGCDTSMSMRTADGTSDETHSTIDIAGRVVDEKGEPLGGIVVATERLGLSDTTDASGRYRIQADRLPGAAAGRIAARRGEIPALDSLIVVREGRELARLPVPQWVVTLADIVVSIRDIAGLLTGDVSRVGRVDAVIRGPGLRLRRMGLSVDTANGTYAGAIEFASFGGDGEVAIELQVFGTDSSHLASSGTLPVPAEGEMVVPPLSTGEAERSVQIILDAPVHEGETIQLHAEARGGFGGGLVSWEWKIVGHSQDWIEGPGPSFRIRQLLGDTTRLWQVLAKARDAQGNVAIDTLDVEVLPLPYRWVKLWPQYLRGLGGNVGEELPFDMYLGGAPERRIVKWEWKLGKGDWTTGTASDSVVVPTQLDSAFRVAVRITDDLGQVSADSLDFAVFSGAFSGAWDFENSRTSPTPGPGDDTTLRVFSNSKSSAQLEWNTIEPVAGAKDLKFTWNLADEGVPGFEDTYAGFDLLLDHGRPVDISSILDELTMTIRGEGLDTTAYLYVGLLSPENPPGDSSSPDANHRMLSWYSWHRTGGATVPWEFTPDLLEWPGWLSPLEEGRREKILSSVVGLRFLLAPMRDRQGEIVPEALSGAIRIDDVKFGSYRGPY